MKTYSTSEAIAMISKNSDLIFELKIPSEYIYTLQINKNNSNTVACYDEYGNERYLNIYASWSLKSKPIGFMKAVSSGYEIKVKHRYIQILIKNNKLNLLGDFMEFSHLMQELYNNLNWYEIKEVILEGDWYIREED